MPESVEVTLQRRQELHLTLVESQAHAARIGLCASDDLMLKAERPQVVVARLNGHGGAEAQDKAAAQRALGAQLFEQHQAQVRQVVEFAQMLGILTGIIQVHQGPKGPRLADSED